MLLLNIVQQLNAKQIVVLFPQKRSYDRSFQNYKTHLVDSLSYTGELSRKIAMISIKNLKSICKQVYQYLDPREQNNSTNYCILKWCESIFIKLNKITKGINFQKIYEQKACIFKKMRAPWFDLNILRNSPCAIQMKQYARLNYICVSWNSKAINDLPFGKYLIGFNIQNILKNLQLGRHLQHYMRIRHQLQIKLCSNQFPSNEKYQKYMALFQKQVADYTNQLLNMSKIGQTQIIYYSYVQNTQKNTRCMNWKEQGQQIITRQLCLINKNKLGFREFLKLISQNQMISETSFYYYLLKQLHPIFSQHTKSLTNFIKVQNNLPILFINNQQNIICSHQNCNCIIINNKYMNYLMQMVKQYKLPYMYYVCPALELKQINTVINTTTALKQKNRQLSSTKQSQYNGNIVSRQKISMVRRRLQFNDRKSFESSDIQSQK